MMAHSNSDQPPPTGRRALPADSGGELSPSSPGGPRRGVPADDVDSSFGNHRWERGRRAVWIAVPVVALLGIVTWNSWHSAPVVTVVASPSAAATTSATKTTPTTSASVAESSSPPDSEPAGSAAPLPGTVSPAPVPSASEEPTPSGSAVAVAVVLNDAVFAAPEGWTLYGDDLIEDGRRAVRLSHAATDTRLQAVTLIPGSDSDLASSCTSLVDLQQAQFIDVTRQLVVPIGVEATTGSGVRCGFMGARSSDGVANTVTFTLVRRSSDSHVLMLRATVPDEVPTNADAGRELGTMSCEASSTFGVALPLC